MKNKYFYLNEILIEIFIILKLDFLIQILKWDFCHYLLNKQWEVEGEEKD